MEMYSQQRPASVDVAGEIYYPDENGVFTVPENVGPALKKRGFVDAARYLQRLAEAETTAAPQTVATLTPIPVAVKQKIPDIPSPKLEQKNTPST